MDWIVPKNYGLSVHVITCDICVVVSIHFCAINKISVLLLCVTNDLLFIYRKSQIFDISLYPLSNSTIILFRNIFEHSSTHRAFQLDAQTPTKKFVRILKKTAKQKELNCVKMQKWKNLTKYDTHINFFNE